MPFDLWWLFMYADKQILIKLMFINQVCNLLRNLFSFTA